MGRMHEVMNENEIAIFFRNNHFSAVYKRNGKIWELVTDEGIVDADPRITWQSLSQLTGDEQFVSNQFNVITQNINQQQQIESYNNTLAQNNNHKNNGFSLEEQQKYLQAQFEESNHQKNKQNEEQKNNVIKEKEKEIKNVMESQQNVDDERMALEQQLGLKSGELAELEREQQKIWDDQHKMQQQDIYGRNINHAISSTHNNDNVDINGYPRPQSHGSYAYTHNIDNYKNESRKQRKKRRKSDDCVVL